MSPETFTRDSAGLEAVGRALYGPMWQTYMARDLGVHDRTVRKWTSGEKPIPPGQWRYIAALLQQRSDDCQGLARAIHLSIPR